MIPDSIYPKFQGETVEPFCMLSKLRSRPCISRLPHKASYSNTPKVFGNVNGLEHLSHRIHVCYIWYYMVTFTITIPPMLVYIPYMDPMGIVNPKIFQNIRFFNGLLLSTARFVEPSTQQRHRVASEMLQLRKPGALGGARREAESRLDDWGTLILSGNLCMDHMASENVGFIYIDGIWTMIGNDWP